MAPRTYVIKHEDGGTAGPVTGSQLMAMAANGKLSPGALVMVVGTDRWVAAGSIPQLAFPAESHSISTATAETPRQTNEESEPAANRVSSRSAPLVFTTPSGSDFWNFSKMITPDVIRLMFIIITVLMGLSLIATPVMCLKELGEISLSNNADFARRERLLDSAEETVRDAESKLRKYLDDVESFRGKPNYTQALQEALDNVRNQESRLSAAAASLGLSPQMSLSQENIEAMRIILRDEKRIVSNKRWMTIAQYAVSWITIPLLWGLARVLFESLIVIFRIYERLTEIQKQE